MLRIKNLVSFTAIAVTLAACGPSTETATIPSPAITTAPATTAPTSPVATATSTLSPETLGVKDFSEIKFNLITEGVESANGFFDAVNNATTTEHTVAKSENLALNGWAVISSANEPADYVILTEGDDNTFVAIAPVNIERADIVEATKNSGYKNSGWTVALNPAALPTDKAVLKAWAYNSDTKEAFQLNRVHTITFNQ
ncbi:MAG: hypothetical protein KME12_25575 [Trichocoleus desertorum ATA4-8-CV12]|jgi:hypothetical protein|nr:hypothetical protein [Trichocoleus desertorum ATA4-8-CV12]